jgi:hypothetical protein
MQRIAITFVALALLGAGACSDDDKPTPSGTGGSGRGGAGGSGSGGSGSGGSSGTGGSVGTGGNTGSGGSGGGTAGSGGSGVDAAGETGGGSGGASGDAMGNDGGGETGGAATMSFFVTSEGAGMGGNLGGLEGADTKCKALAMAVSAELGAKTWRAYLSTSTVNARDRIGTGPWRNAKGEIIANDLNQLHDQGMNGMLNATWPIGAAAVAKILDEKGMPIPSGGAGGQRHDILTGTNAMGMVDGSNHCNNWMATTGMATVGHSNRSGGMRDPSWTTAHTSGCGAIMGDQNNVGGTVSGGGGRGAIYCFAIN